MHRIERIANNLLRKEAFGVRGESLKTQLQAKLSDIKTVAEQLHVIARKEKDDKWVWKLNVITRDISDALKLVGV